MQVTFISLKLNKRETIYTLLPPFNMNRTIFSILFIKSNTGKQKLWKSGAVDRF